MQVQNSFKFNLEDLCSKKLICATKPKSLALGRRVFYSFEEHQQYWLKTQTLKSEKVLEDSFQHELEFYLSLTHQQAKNITLPYQILSHSAVINHCGIAMPLLILPHAKCLFAESPQILSIDQIKNKMIQALSTLENLHKAGWLHADLKTEHFVEYDSHAKLIDFEQSIKIEDVANIRALNATPRYMAPELFHAEAKSIESDIYALGIIFYEWLNQERPFAKNYYDWAVLHCQKLEIELPEAYLCFKSTLNAMLHKQKKLRLSDISALKIGLITENV